MDGTNWGQLVKAAMERTIKRGKDHWGYTEATLQNWYEKGYKTLNQVELEAEQFKQQRRENFKKK